MGISGFLPKVLKTAGRPLDLEAIAKSGGIFMTPSEAERYRKRQKASTDVDVDETMTESEHEKPDTQDLSVLPSPSYQTIAPRRPLRIGVDVSCWIYRAAFGFGDMLGDERHLSSYGRAALVEEAAARNSSANKGKRKFPDENKSHEFIQTCVDFVMRRIKSLQEQSKAKIIVVLDGATPPIKRLTSQERRSTCDKYLADRDEPVDPALCRPFLASARSVGEEIAGANNLRWGRSAHSSTSTVDTSTAGATVGEEAVNAANEKRTKAFRRAGAGKHYPSILSMLMGSLIQNDIPFMVSPYESDSQLAYLSQIRLIDLVITEDSDLVAHGATSILYKWDGADGHSEKNANVPLELRGYPHRVLQPATDLGAVPGSMDLTDFSPVMVAVLFVAVGGDYREKLDGIGLISASRIVRCAFLEPWTLKYGGSVDSAASANVSGEKSTKSNASWSTDRTYMKANVPALALTIQELFRQSRCEKMDVTQKKKYEERFLAALFAYRHPIVYDPVQKKCVIVQRGKETVISGLNGNNSTVDNDGNIVVFGDPELIDYAPYAALCSDPIRRSSVVGSIPEQSTASQMAGGMALRSKLNELIASRSAKTNDARSGALEADAALEDRNESQMTVEESGPATQDLAPLR